MATTAFETGDAYVSSDFFNRLLVDVASEMSGGRSFAIASRKLGLTHLPNATVVALQRAVEPCGVPALRLATSIEVNTHG